MTEAAFAAPADEAGATVTADSNVPMGGDDDLGAVFDRHMRDNGSARASDGKFTSTQPAANSEPNGDGDNTAPLEGGEGEGADEGTPPPSASSVPLPATLTGLDEVWGKIPAEAQEALAANQKKIHQTLSDQGRFIATFRPIGEVFSDFREYFGGDRGDYNPAEATRYLFSLQKEMDENPLPTLLKIADTYELRPKLAEMFAGQVSRDGSQPQQPDNTNALLAEISELKRTISGLTDPSRIDQRIHQKIDEERTLASVNDLISRIATPEAMPLYKDVEIELPDYIAKAWGRLGDTASQDAVLKLAYDMAVNADPDLRKKAAALLSAATPDPKRVEDAKRATQTNIRSTSTGKSREPTEDELLGDIFDKHKR